MHKLCEPQPERSKGENMVEIWRNDASCLSWYSRRGARKHCGLKQMIKETCGKR